MNYDLVVIGSTPGGIACAIRAAREGVKVLLTNYHDKPGGMETGGLGGWETLCDGHVRAPIYSEIRLAIIDHYRRTYGEDSPQFKAANHRHHGNGRFEPFVGLRYFREWIAREPNLTLLTPYYPVSAVTRDGRVREVVLRHSDHAEDTVRVAGKIFADCTYEGDFLACANVPFRLGREARSEYREPSAGRVHVLNKPPALPADPVVHRLHSRLNIRHVGTAQVRLDLPGDGVADPLIQAINYRTILSSDPENRALPRRPDDYDPAEFAPLDYAPNVSPIPNDKISWNRPQLIGLQNEYIEGDWAARKRVLARHWRATVGLLYYLQHDAPLPPEVRARWRQFGFALDEGLDQEHPPCEIYVREGRRLEGRKFLTEHDVRLAEGLERSPIHADSIAFTDWYLDCHACSPGRREGSMHEGKMMLHGETFPSQIPYGSIVSGTVANVLAPVPLAATHVAFGAVRLEVAWMNLGESAGFAAALALKLGVDPGDLPADRLLRRLAAAGVSLGFFNDVGLTLGEPWFPAIQYFGTKGFFPTFDARPGEALTAEVAREWLKIFASFQEPGFDPNASAREVLKAERGCSGPLERAAWHRLLAQADLPVPSSPFSPSSSPLTRADACNDLWSHLF